MYPQSVPIPARQRRLLSKLADQENQFVAPAKATKKPKMVSDQSHGSETDQTLTFALLQKRRPAIPASPNTEWTPLAASKHAQETVNPIRRVTDSLSVAPNPAKAPIRLNLGDPTLTGCLPPSEATVAAIRDAVESHRFDGYGPAVGLQAAREAVAEVSTETDLTGI